MARAPFGGPLSKYVPRILSLVAGLALVGGGIFLIVSGFEIHGAGLIAGGVGTIAAPQVFR